MIKIGLSSLKKLLKRLEPFSVFIKRPLALSPAKTSAPHHHRSLPVSIPKITLEDNFVHAYTDGSCSYNNGLLGLGVVIPTNDKHMKIVFSKRVVPAPDYNIRQFGAMKAEFMAATLALQALPTGTNVHLYTDHPILRKVLKRHIANRPLLWSPQSQPNHRDEFVAMVKDLQEQLDDKGTIRVTSLNDRLSRRMEIAHKAAARGSGASGIKVRKREKPPPASENAFLATDPREDTAIAYSSPLDKITFD